MDTKARKHRIRMIPSPPPQGTNPNLVMMIMAATTVVKARREKPARS